MKTRRLIAAVHILIAVAFLGAAKLATGATADATNNEPPRVRNSHEPQVPLTKPLSGTVRYRWEHVENKSVALIGPCGVVWQFNFGTDLAKPYFHPLQTADGHCLTWVSPRDHVWHYALWHSWKFINGVNYWEENPNTRRSEGTSKITKVDVKFSNETGARIKVHLAYFATDKPDEIVMEEAIELAVEMPREDGSYRIDWSQVSSPKQTVVLDRTPPPGKKDGVAWGGYAGLSFRGSRFLAEVTATQGSGKTGMDGNRQRAEWHNMAGKVDGKPVGITIFDHPSNPGHPTVWYYLMQSVISEKAPWPFWYMNAAIVHDGPIELNRGQLLALRYLVRIDGGIVPVSSLKEEYKQFSAIQP